jgi:hypothetical protein
MVDVLASIDSDASNEGFSVVANWCDDMWNNVCQAHQENLFGTYLPYCT